MFEAAPQNQESYKVESAMIGLHSTSEGDAFATYHEVSNKGRIQSGKPLTMEQVYAHVASLVESSENGAAWRDNRVVYESADILAWVSKSKKHSMWFRIGGKAFRVNAVWPNLLFVVHKSSRSLKVMATARSSVTKLTRLYEAPLCNISKGGAVCQGNATLPDRQIVGTTEVLDECEATIYNSNFTHVNSSVTLKDCPDTNKHVAAWKKFAKENRKPKASEMVKANVTVESYIKALESNRYV